MHLSQKQQPHQPSSEWAEHFDFEGKTTRTLIEVLVHTNRKNCVFLLQTCFSTACLVWLKGKWSVEEVSRNAAVTWTNPRGALSVRLRTGFSYVWGRVGLYKGAAGEEIILFCRSKQAFFRVQTLLQKQLRWKKGFLWASGSRCADICKNDSLFLSEVSSYSTRKE